MDTSIKEQQSIWHSIRGLLVSKAIDFEMFNNIKACQVRVITVHNFFLPFYSQRHLFSLYSMQINHTVQIKLSYKLHIPLKNTGLFCAT